MRLYRGGGSSGGGASASFTTFQTPTGTSPVATGPTDALTLASDGSLTLFGDATSDTVTMSIDTTHENVWTATQTFNEADVVRTPAAPPSASINFVADGAGFFANGTTYSYVVYSYYNAGIAGSGFDSAGASVSASDPNDANTYNIDLSWTAATDANGYIVYDTNTGLYIDVGNVLGATITPSTSWISGPPTLSPSTVTVPGVPVFVNSGVNWTTTDGTLAYFGSDGTNSLRLRWYYLGAAFNGALKFEDDSGNRKWIDANLYGDSVSLSNTLTTNSVITSSLYVSGLATKQVLHSQAGTVSGDAGFEWDWTTNRLLVASASFTAQSKLHIDAGTGTASDIRFTAGSTTNQTSSDGFQVGISATAVAELRQRENAGIEVYTLNTLRATWTASASPRYIVYGGTEAQYNALGSTSTDGIIISNLTSATGGATIQRSGRLRFSSQVWDTGAAATRTDDWIIQPVITSGSPGTSVLSLENQYNSGGYTQYLSMSSAGLMTTFGNITLTPSASGGSGTNRTISFGNGYANPAIYLYNGGVATRYGWGMQAGSMQFFAQTSTGNNFTWNIGGDLNATGTNEIMRLIQYASGTGAGLSLGTVAFSAATPYRIDLRSVTAAGGAAGVENMIRFSRDQTGGVSYPQAFAIGLGRYSSAGTGPDTRVDFLLKATAATDYTPGVAVMSLNANSRVGIGVTAPAASLEVLSTTQQIRASYDASNYLGVTVSSAGAVTFDAVGASAGFTFSDDVTMADAKNIITNGTTGTKIGTAASQKISVWNATPIVQPTTAVAAATFVANTSGIADDSATFDGYTIGQVVKALRNMGVLA